MKIKTFIIFITAACSFMLPAGSALSQSGNKQQVKAYYDISSGGDQSKVNLTSTSPLPQNFSEKKSELLRQLEIARSSNDAERSEQLQDRLNQLNGTTTERLPSSPEAHFELSTSSNPPFEHDYNTSQIHNLSILSNAVATVPVGAPNAGRLWVASTEFSLVGGDSIKFYYSDNGGQSWGYYGKLFLNFNNNFSNDELDIELVYDGTSVWMFGIAGLTDFADNRQKCLLFRFNTGGGPGYVNVLNFPGNAVGNNYYNPRLCTDNSNYTTSTYVYIVCSLDSLASLSHAVKQKFLHLSSIFAAAPVYDFTQPNGSGGFFWNNSGTTTRIRTYGDIGYYRQSPGNDRVMTVFSDAGYGFNSMYLAWSDDFGSTIAGSLILSESQYSKDAKINFNGGPTYTSGMISYAKQITATDWDPYSINTTSGGTTAPSWTGVVMNNTITRARSCDVVAIRGANNLFKAAYAMDNTVLPVAVYQGFNGTSWSTPTVVSNLPLDTLYSRPRAGYLNGGGDDCLSIWSLAPNGFNAYVSRLCSGTLGIGNNQAPAKFSLAQNYPNPFNPVTSIRFELPKSSNVKLNVYDITGKLVSTLVNSNISAGAYNISFDASKLSSGVYLYKLEAGDFTSVKKMLLVK